MHYGLGSSQIVPALGSCPGFASGTATRNRAAFRPDGAMIEGHRWPSEVSCSRSGRIGRLCLSGRLRRAQEASNGVWGLCPHASPGRAARTRSIRAGQAATSRRTPPCLARPHACSAHCRGISHQGPQHRLLSADLRAPHHCQVRAPLCICLLYTSPSPRDGLLSRMPSSA